MYVNYDVIYIHFNLDHSLVSRVTKSGTRSCIDTDYDVIYIHFNLDHSLVSRVTKSRTRCCIDTIKSSWRWA